MGQDAGEFSARRVSRMIGTHVKLATTFTKPSTPYTQLNFITRTKTFCNDISQLSKWLSL